MKRIAVCFLVIGMIFLIGISLSQIDSCDDATLNPDCYYGKEPAVAAARANAIHNEKNSQADTSELPLLVLPSSESHLALSTDVVQCTVVFEGDGVGSAAERANSNVFPPSVFAGIDMQVFIRHDSDKTIMTLADAIKTSPIIYAGDVVCISINPSLFEGK
jgi:hypothetical protein